MYLLLLVVTLLNFCAASEEIQKNRHIDIGNHDRNNHGLVKKSPHDNLTYIDKDENVLRVPTLNNYFEEQKSKKKPKKSPKRTIQKIIKKNKGKLRKVYFNQSRKQSTAPPKVSYEKIYGQDEVKKWKDETTTRPLHKHKVKNNKMVRNHMPFQTLHKKKDDKRHKRSLSRELFILKDLDHIEFLSKEKDNDVVKAQIANYWSI